jgi:hypothetical protein
LPGRNQRDWPVSEAGTEVSCAPAKAIAWQAKCKKNATDIQWRFFMD